MDTGTVVGAWRYPVKSLGGEAVPELVLSDRGVEGDRVLAVYGADGKIGSGKSTSRFRRMDGLLDWTARTDADGTIRIGPPRAEHVALDHQTVERLSYRLGERVTIRQEEAVSHFDVAPVHLLTIQSLSWLADLLGATVAVQRFRPNLVLDGSLSCSERIEDDWLGRRVRVGEAILAIRARAERCVMVDMAQGGVTRLAGDSGILRALANEADACFGVYADVLIPGRVRVGDPYELVD